MKKILIILLILFLYGCESNEIILENDNSENNLIYVNVVGKVKFPGIYQIQEPKYLYEVIELAGGFLKNACIDNLNLVQVIDRDCTINILGDDKIEDSGLININYASIDQLKLLPGVGEVYANKIIEYRSINGLFMNKEDIMKVSGIKVSVFEKIKDLITI